MSSENQHWVPKFLIKNFAASDGRVFRFDIHAGEVTKPPPRLAASDFGFNEFLIDGKAVVVEDRLRKAKPGQLASLKHLVLGRSFAGLTTRKRLRVANFVAGAELRTEAF